MKSILKMITVNTNEKTDNLKSGAPVFRGVVVSTGMKDTAVVEVQSFRKHAKYQKFIKRSKNYSIHDAGNTVKVGDKVSFVECRPISKNKKFKLVKSF